MKPGLSSPCYPQGAATQPAAHIKVYPTPPTASQSVIIQLLLIGDQWLLIGVQSLLIANQPQRSQSICLPRKLKA